MSWIAKTIRARVQGGILEPLEKLGLPEGTEVRATITQVPDKGDTEAFRRSFGAWKGNVDCEKLIRDIYESRLGPGPDRQEPES